jgi:hypothetical protein
MKYFEVLNEGSQNQIFLIGDSHTMAVAMRFKQLFEEAKKKN